jgi:GcrA cell cycle regulator
LAKKYTDDMILEMAALWNNGKTSNEIAAEYRMSRGSFMGLVHRNREKFNPKPALPAFVKVVEARERKRNPDMKAPAPPITITAPLFSDQPEFDRFPLVQIGPRNCRWPVNEGGPFLFCGRFTDDHKRVYCKKHTERAKVAPR